MSDSAVWNEFFRTGALGPIKLGMAFADVPKILGKPKGHSNRRGWEGYDYEVLKVGGYQNQVITITVMHFLLNGATDVTRTLNLTSPFDHRSTCADVVTYLDAHGIRWADAATNGIDGIHIGKCVVAVFAEDGTLESLMARQAVTAAAGQS